MHPHPPSPPPRKLLKLISPFLFIYYFIFGKSQIGWLLIRLHLFHITVYRLKVKYLQNIYLHMSQDLQKDTSHIIMLNQRPGTGLHILRVKS